MLKRVKIELELDIKVSDENIKNANQQYGYMTEDEVAKNMAAQIIRKGIDKQNREITYWDGVAIMQGNIQFLETHY